MKKFEQFLFFFLFFVCSVFPVTVYAESNSPPRNENSNTNTDTIDSKILINGSASTNTNLAAINSGKLSGYVWNDGNKDGIFQSESEKPIEGITVYLYSSGNAITSTTTLDTGDFSFTGLAMSTYEIVINQNNFGNGSVLSTKLTWNGLSKNNNFTKKSSDKTLWTTGTITLGYGETLINFGCGVYDPTRLLSDNTVNQENTQENTQGNSTNPKTADETLYLLPIVALLGSTGLIIISKRKVKKM